MTPTEELRAKLDELGVEHFDHENGEPLRDLSEAGTDPATSWRMGGANVCVVPNKQGTFDLWIDSCTPEQAIAATVGAGTCHDLAETPSYRDKTEFKCSECGYEYSAVGGFGCDYGDEPDFNFCPNCGRKVVSE